MKTLLRIGVAVVLLVCAGLGGTESAPRMTVLIKPGAMSETVGKGMWM